MGRSRITYFENCLMAITVQLCHVASTFQKGGKQGQKQPGWSTSNHCHLPYLRIGDGRHRRAWSLPCDGNGPAQHSSAASAGGQRREWRVTLVAGHFAFLGL